MIEHVLQQGWVYSGNCGGCDHGLYYLNTKHPGWRLKISGNTMGLIQQNQNPINKQDYKNIDIFDNKNYIDKLNRFA